MKSKPNDSLRHNNEVLAKLLALATEELRIRPNLRHAIGISLMDLKNVDRFRKSITPSSKKP